MSGQQERDEARAKLKHAVVGFVTTAVIAVVSKIVVIAIDSDSGTSAINYLADNFGFWFTAIASALSGGYFAQKWTK